MPTGKLLDLTSAISKRAAPVSPVLLGESLWPGNVVQVSKADEVLHIVQLLAKLGVDKGVEVLVQVQVAAAHFFSAEWHLWHLLQRLLFWDSLI